MREWAGQIYSGMDFLGDSGIVHRSISPKHVLLTVSPEDGEKTVAKLSSFRDSVLYYDVVTSTVRLMAVLEKERAKATSNASCYNFFAPEVFGLGGGGGGGGGNGGTGIGNDLYNPIPAEVWSFGATFFFANTRAFPVKYGEVSSAVDVPLAIEGALGRARNLSPEAKGWFSGLLKAAPQERTAFEAIAADPWFRAALPMSAPAAAVEDKAPPPPPSPQQQPPPPQPFQLHQQLQQQQQPPQPPQQQQNPPTTFTPPHTDAPGADPFARGGSFQLQPKQQWQQPANLYPPPPPAQMEPPRVPFQLSNNNGTPQQQQMQPNSMVGGNFPPPPLQQGPPPQQQPPPPPPQTGSQPPPVQVVIYQTPNQFGVSGKQQQQPQQQLQQQFGAQPPPRPPPPAGPF